MERLHTFVDRGGTFTDVVVLLPGGGARVTKVPSDRAVVGELAEGHLCFGTTVATNALLERKGVPALLVVTRGFRDLPLVGDQSRPSLFDPDADRPPPLCRRVVELPGRIDTEGRELEPIDTGPLREVDWSGIRAVAVALVNSPRNPAHELAVARALPPEPFVSLGHRVSPELGYLARIETTLVDAALTPVLRAALERDRIPPGALAMRSDGGLSPATELRAPDAVLSGPAGAVLAVAQVARQGGFQRAVGLDMGGTSTDVCRVEAGRLPRREGETIVAGVRLRRPLLEVETIAAGGGSVLHSTGRRFAVGPDSAGADPGPACYGRGGPPTLTDAALEAGLLDPTSFDPPLDRSAVHLPGPALDFLEIAREAMAAAVNRIATARGVDLRDHALVACGGAAGQHAAHVAGRLGIRTVLVHPCAAVLSAWGQALARREESGVLPVWRPLPEGWPEVEAAWAEIEGTLPGLGETLRTVELRHAGTDHAIEVRGDDARDAMAAFAAEHRRRFGFDRPGLRIEAVNARVRTRAPARPPPRVAADPWGIGGRTVVGPALLRSPHTTVHVPGGWKAVLRDGLLRLERTAPPPRRRPSTQRSPRDVELWGNRFMAVAQQAGEVLRRLARSVNVRERLDFSCAVFDARGGLVANAPHIPVHLGAMGETLRDLLATVPDPPPGQSWLGNDPASGGSHLPDLTVLTSLQGGAWVGCRAHHVDVGGVIPGSMPPRSTSIEQEGLLLRHVPLMEGGRPRPLGELLRGCRQPEVVVADIEAQIAANAHAARLLRELGPPELLAAWMAHLQDVAAEAVSERIAGLPEGRACDEIDGIPLRVALRRQGAELVIDFGGTGGPHPGNLNAPAAVLRAAVLHALRCLVQRQLPLNDGAMRPVRLLVPRPSILAPPPGAAVAGGNVETSQRIADLLLAAAGARAPSQGTMNNLTLAGEGWSLYETVGGGFGASPRGPGRSARQVHMTNTRATDVEVVELRYPLRVRRFEIRRGSGGPGRHRGGDGILREIEVLAPTRAALLATRRSCGPPGLAGGGAGKPGRDQLLAAGRWRSWDGREIVLQPGQRVRIETPGGGGWGPATPGP